MEASRILLQHKSNTDWVALTLTSCTYNEYLPYLEAETIHPHHSPPLPTGNVASLPKMTSCLNQLENPLRMWSLGPQKPWGQRSSTTVPSRIRRGTQWDRSPLKATWVPLSWLPMIRSTQNIFWNYPKTELPRHISLVTLHCMFPNGTRQRVLFVCLFIY